MNCGLISCQLKVRLVKTSFYPKIFSLSQLPKIAFFHSKSHSLGSNTKKLFSTFRPLFNPCPPTLLFLTNTLSPELWEKGWYLKLFLLTTFTSKLFSLLSVSEILKCPWPSCRSVRHPWCWARVRPLPGYKSWQVICHQTGSKDSWDENSDEVG